MRWKLFKPQMVGAQLGDRLWSAVGAAGALATIFAVHQALARAGLAIPTMAAPLAASAAIVFLIPASPLAQPWRVIGGNVLSALVGIAAYHMIPSTSAAAALALGGAILVMTLARCLHPPGAAMALTTVIGSAAVHDAGFSYAALPIALDSVTLTLVALLFHRLCGHSYPHRASPPEDLTVDRQAAGFIPEDFDRAVADMHETFDISRDDLEALLSRAERHALARRNAGSNAQN